MDIRRHKLICALPLLGVCACLDPAVGSPDSGAHVDDATADAAPLLADAATAFDDAGGKSDARVDDSNAELHDAGATDAAAPDLRPAPDVAPVPDATGAAPNIWERCFSHIYDPAKPAPDYDSYGPTYADSCLGTNHQDIQGVERVVFVGDSVTVGTPPTQSSRYYRSLLSDLLAEHFDLEPPSALWRTANLVTGECGLRDSGDFACCAKYGARTDDLLRDHDQLVDCMPEEQRHKRTLVIITIGGNDLAGLTQYGAHAPYETSRAMVEEAIGLLQDALRWIKAPGRFPNGVHVVFSNMFEYTDGTADLGSCPAAAVAGFAEEWDHPEWLEELVIWSNEQYMATAVETQSDLLMMLELFCGHGFHHDNPDARCYLGPDAEQWLDLTCIHPNPAGHQQLAEMFMSLIVE